MGSLIAASVQGLVDRLRKHTTARTESSCAGKAEGAKPRCQLRPVLWLHFGRVLCIFCGFATRKPPSCLFHFPSETDTPTLELLIPPTAPAQASCRASASSNLTAPRRPGGPAACRGWSCRGGPSMCCRHRSPGPVPPSPRMASQSRAAGSA